MPGDISIPLQKLERARFHLRSINSELDAGRNLYDLTIEPAAEADQYLLQLRECPHTLAEGIGDYLHNLRATLDYLAFQLAGAPQKKFSKGSFPIRTCEAKFDEDARHCLKGVAGKAVNAIKELQPFPPGFSGKREDHPLWLLNALVNVDKHRFIHAATFRAEEFTWTVDTATGGQIARRLDIPEPLEPLTTLALIFSEATPTLTEPCLLAFVVRLAATPLTPELGLTVLDHMLDAVENVVDKLRPFF